MGQPLGHKETSCCNGEMGKSAVVPRKAEQLSTSEAIFGGLDLEKKEEELNSDEFKYITIYL